MAKKFGKPIIGFFTKPRDKSKKERTKINKYINIRGG